MRRSAESRGPPLILDRDGRALPFDGRRLNASIHRALSLIGPGHENEAEDLAGVVSLFLRREAVEETLSADQLAGYVRQVLEGAGHEEAARLYARTRRQRDHGVAARVRELLAGVEDVDLPTPLATQIVSEVESGLRAAGLKDPAAGLLREWVDHTLRTRGLPDGLGRNPTVGLPGHELRSLLASGPPGLAAEVRGAGALLRQHALQDVFPDEVAQAHAEGRLDFGTLASRSRIHGLCFAPWTIPEVRRAEPGCRISAVGSLLRDMSTLVTHEVRVLWNGPVPDGDQLGQLHHQLAQPADVGARIVICLPAAETGLVRAFLSDTWFDEAAGASTPGKQGTTWRLRVHGLPDDPTLLSEIAARPLDVEVARVEPRQGLILGACALNLLRPAMQLRGDGPSAITDQRAADPVLVSAGGFPGSIPAAFLDAVEEVAGLAAAGLSAWGLQGLGEAAAEAIRKRLGIRLASRWWLEPAGLVQARVVLLGAGVRARQNGRDLAVAVGERLRRGWSRRWPVRGADPTETEPGSLTERLSIVPASPRAQRRFRRLDLPLRPGADEHPGVDATQEPLGEGETFSHDGEADPAARGREVALLRRCLDSADHAPAPRNAGDPFVRESFLRAFLDPSLEDSETDSAPCA